MKSRFLFPARFKRVGLWMAPFGFIVWTIIQQGIVDIKLQEVKTIFLATSFFSFLIGMVLLVLSKEKIEDEYTQRVRLESYQFAALFQFFVLLCLTMLVVFFENRFGRIVFEQIPVFLILLFWFVYFIRFNGILYFSKSFRKQYEK